MKNVWIFIKKNIISMIIILAVSFLAGYFGGNLYNEYHSYYEATFTIDDSSKVDISKIDDADYLKLIRDKDSKWKDTDVDKMLKKNGFTVTVSGNEVTIQTGYQYYEWVFVKSSLQMSTRVKTYVRAVVRGLEYSNEEIASFESAKEIDKLPSYSTFKNPTDIVDIKGQTPIILIGVYTGIAGLILGIGILLIIHFKRKEDTPFVYDNENSFRTIFHKAYWKKAITAVSDVKSMVILAMLFALMLIAKLIPIPSGFGDLGLSFTYLFFAIVGMLYGPVYGFIIGIFSDIIGFFIGPSTGYFFLGYTLQAALTGFIYGICFYRTKVNFGKVFLARFLVNIFMNALFGSYLYARVFTDMAPFSSDFNQFVRAYMLVYSLPKNLVYLLPQSILLYVVFRGVAPILKRYKFIDDQTYQHLKLTY